jgi:hypothetical protein
MGSSKGRANSVFPSLMATTSMSVAMVSSGSTSHGLHLPHAPLRLPAAYDIAMLVAAHAIVSLMTERDVRFDLQDRGLRRQTGGGRIYWSPLFLDVR